MVPCSYWCCLWLSADGLKLKTVIGYYFLTLNITSVPKVTAPLALVSSFMSSILEMITGVKVDLALASRKFKSNSIRHYKC